MSASQISDEVNELLWRVVAALKRVSEGKISPELLNELNDLHRQFARLEAGEHSAIDAALAKAAEASGQTEAMERMIARYLRH